MRSGSRETLTQLRYCEDVQASEKIKQMARAEGAEGQHDRHSAFG